MIVDMDIKDEIEHKLMLRFPYVTTNVELEEDWAIIIFPKFTWSKEQNEVMKYTIRMLRKEYPYIKRISRKVGDDSRTE